MRQSTACESPQRPVATRRASSCRQVEVRGGNELRAPCITGFMLSLAANRGARCKLPIILQAPREGGEHSKHNLAYNASHACDSDQSRKQSRAFVTWVSISCANSYTARMNCERCVRSTTSCLIG